MRGCNLSLADLSVLCTLARAPLSRPLGCFYVGFLLVDCVQSRLFSLLQKSPSFFVLPLLMPQTSSFLYHRVWVPARHSFIGYGKVEALRPGGSRGEEG